ncbi:MAG: 4Fe-4S binding protein [Sphaerochaetaceae bacterium]
MGTKATIAILSGKGGTGKTLVSVNLATVAEDATFIDCDVEEPNGQLFIKPILEKEHVVTEPKPVVDQSLCDGCHSCVDACAFNALALIGKNLLVFDEICHSCGLCTYICPRGALHEEQRPLGIVKRGRKNGITFLSGEMHIGKSSAVPIIKTLMKEQRTDFTIIDGPPGSGCLVTETISNADFCLLVAEPTLFGAHNLAMIHELVTVLGKPSAVLLNKTTKGNNPSEDYAKAHNIKIVGTLPYDEHLALLSSNGLLAAEEDETYHTYFKQLLETVLQEVADASDSVSQR